MSRIVRDVSRWLTGLALLAVGVGRSSLVAEAEALSPAPPQTWCVQAGAPATGGAPCANANAFSTIQEAVDIAAAGDEILIAQGSYSTSGTSVVSVDKDLAMIGGFPGNASGWSSTGSSSLTVFDGVGTAVGLTILGTPTVSLQNLTINNGGIQNSAGTVNVNGSSVILRGGVTTTGVFTLATGATLGFRSGTNTLGNGTTITGNGEVSVSGGTLTVGSSPSDQVALSNLKLANAELTGPGSLTVNGAFGWSSGDMTGTGSTTVGSSGSLTLAGSGTPGIDSRTLILNGPTTISDGSGTLGALFTSGGATIVNNSTVTFEGQSTIAKGGGAFASFLNNGTLLKAIGTGTTTININLDNAAGGTLAIQTGLLSMAGGGTNSGTFSIDPSATLNFAGNTYTIDSTGTLNGTGLVSVTAGTVNVNTATPVTVGTLSIGGGTMSFNNPTTTVSTLNLSSGTLGGTGQITITGVSTWSNGKMNGTGSTTVANSGSLALAGTTNQFLDKRTLTLDGPTTISTGTSSLFVTSGATIVNNNALTFQGDTNISYNGGAFPSLINNGTLTKAGGTGTTTININLNNASMGTLEVQAGLVSLVRGGTNSGAFNIGPNATLNFPSNTYTISSTGTMNGNGLVSVTGGTVTVDSASPLTMSNVSVNNGTIVFNNPVTTVSTLTLTTGTVGGTGAITVIGPLTWAAGQMTGTGSTTVANAGSISLDGVSSQFLDTRALILNGPTTFGAGSGGLFVSNGATVVNNNILTFQGDTSVLSNGGAASTLTNNGKVTKAGGAGTTTIGIGLDTAAAKTVNVSSGTLALAGGGTTSGIVTVDPGAALSFGGGTSTLDSGSTLNVGGTLNISGGTLTVNTVASLIIPTLTISGGTVLFNAPETAVTTLTLASGSLGGTSTVTVNGVFTWTSGKMSGSGSTIVANNGALVVDGTANLFLDTRALILDGPATFAAGPGDLFVSNGATIVNNDTLTFQGDTGIGYEGGLLPTLTNHGIVTRSGGAGMTSIVMILDNAADGTISVTTDSYYAFGTDLTNAGTIDISDGATLAVSGSFFQTSGTTSISKLATFAITGTGILQGGTLVGTGAVAGNLSNKGGTISPGFSAGPLTITGTYSQGASGTLAIEIGGTSGGTQFDQFIVGETAALDGTLSLSTINGFTPSATDTFKIMTFASSTGNFATVTGGDFGGGIILVSQVNPHDVTLGSPLPTLTLTPADTATPTATESTTAAPTGTDTPTATSSPTITSTATDTATTVPSSTTTSSSTSTVTTTHTASATGTACPTITSTATVTPSSTTTASPTSTPAQPSDFLIYLPIVMPKVEPGAHGGGW